jgi:WD40 repeat protein
MRLAAVIGTSMALAGGAAAQETGIFRNGPDDSPRALDGAVVRGGIDFAESCSYDPVRDLVVVPNQGVRASDGGVNDGYVALVNHDGTTNTLKWLQGGGEEDPALWINDPFGSDIVDGVLYLGDLTGDPAHGVVTMWDMESGEMLGMHEIPTAGGVNDLEVAEDGTIFTSWHGSSDDPSTWTIHRIDPDGTVTLLLDGEQTNRPNGIAFDPDGNVVVVNLTNEQVNTYDREGNLLGTSNAAEGRNDGLVIMPDGTMYITSVGFGSIHRLAPDGSSEVLAVGIPSAASMCFDEGGNQLVVPMNNNDALAYYPLD